MPTTDDAKIKLLTLTVRNLAEQIDWLLSFLDKKAKESGDVAGMQTNARQVAEEAKRLLQFYAVEDAGKARDLADKQ
jgi:hypothetical protein